MQRYFGGGDMDKDFPKRSIRLKNNLRIACMEVANGDQPVLWIHGMGSYRETFHPLFRHPPVPGRHVAMDLPGFGHSSHLPRRHTLEDYAESVRDVAQQLGLEKPILVGHSFGGMVVGETLVHFPDAVGGAIFVSSAGWFDPENALVPTPYFWINRIGIWITGMDYFGRRMMASLGVEPDMLTTDDRRRLRFGWRHAYEMARMGQFYASPDFSRRVQGTGVPIGVIHGDRDLLFPLGRLKAELHDETPLWVIDGAGHVPFYSRPDAFTTAFRSAFQFVAAGRSSGSR